MSAQSPALVNTNDSSNRHQVPVVVTGFEPVDLLKGILACLRLVEHGTPRVENHYTRAVRMPGNLAAQEIVDQVYEVAETQSGAVWDRSPQEDTSSATSSPTTTPS